MVPKSTRCVSTDSCHSDSLSLVTTTLRENGYELALMGATTEDASSVRQAPENPLPPVAVTVK
jgi:hypothetical protein